MPVRQQDRVHLADSPPGVLDGTCHLVGPPGNSRVDQDHAIVDDDGLGIHISDGDLDDAVNHLAHAIILPRGASDWVSGSQRLANQWRDFGAKKLDRAHGQHMIDMGGVQLEPINLHQLV